MHGPSIEKVFWATEGLNFLALLFWEGAEHFWRRAVLDLRFPAHAKFENVALFLRLYPPSTLIRRKGRAQRNPLQARDLKTPAFRFHPDGRRFETD